MLTELKGSSLNQVVKVKPVSWGHLVRGGTITALPAFPGNEKNTSGPDLKRKGDITETFVFAAERSKQIAANIL